jgi:PRTRC genetic system protein A
MFPVYMKKKGSQPPATVPHYIVAKNGIFLKKESWWMEAVVPVKQIAVLEEQKTGCELKFPPLSAVMLAKAWKFFKAVYKKHHSESAVLLHYSERLGWELTIPEQTVTFSHVDYKMADRLAGYVFIGTMHSHSSMSAFHSGTDIGDEAQIDGIHITFGDVDEPDQFSMDAEVVVNGTRFMLPLDFMEGVSVVEKETTRLSAYTSTVPRYTITCPELEAWKVPDDWMKRVTTSSVKPLSPLYLQRYGEEVVMADENPMGGPSSAIERKLLT